MGKITSSDNMLLTMCTNLNNSVKGVHIDKAIKLKSEINIILKTI